MGSVNKIQNSGEFIDADQTLGHMSLKLEPHGTLFVEVWVLINLNYRAPSVMTETFISGGRSVCLIKKP